jgi:hypothetical protein
MKTFKLIDLVLNIVLILFFTILSLVKYDITFIYGYFIVGGWQVISMLVHQFAGWFTRKGNARNTYFTITLIIILTGLLALMIPIFLFIYYVLLFAAPGLAVAYTLICYDECREMKRRPIKSIKYH